jgi:hypothetical protein
MGLSGSFGLVLDAFFDTHVLQFAGLEDLAALETFHKFGVFIATDDLHTRMLARFTFCVGWLRERL